MNDQENLAGSSETAEAGGDRPEPKVIKRYTNRKLYDTVESRYVTLDEIAQMIKGGAEVKIIDNRSKEDLTSVTLAQIIFEEEKKRSQMPLGVLREIIRHGGDAVAGFYNEKVAQRLNERIGEVRTKADSLRDEVEARLRGVTSILRRDGKEAAEGAPAAAPKTGQMKEIITAGVEELRGRVEAGVKTTLEVAAGSTAALSSEVDKLQKKLHELEKKIEQLTK